MPREPSSTRREQQPPATPLPEIGGYRLERVLGHGGMSTVYLARQVSLERQVALKVMLPEALTDEVSRRRFENEARTIARLDHPNIVSIFEVGRSQDGLPYYAMPYLPRGHLGQREFAHDPVRVRSILHALLSALEYAHGRGVVHRDVKAENVLFDDTERPMLADFGIALRRGYGTRVTTAGLAVGSTAYMPPEQARGHNVDGRADLYSVGVLGWEMLTGKLPYNAGDALSMALQHAQEPIPRLPPELRQWQKFFDKALAKTPEGRFASARDMRDALDRVPEHASAQWISAATRGASGWGKPLAWAGGALLLAAAIGFALFRDAAPEAPVAGTDPSEPVTTPADAQAAATSDAADETLDALMRPLPEVPAERLLALAQAQLQEGRLAAPASDNAYESFLAAARADAKHPRLQPVATALVGALSEQATKSVRANALQAAAGDLEKARTLARQARLPTAPTDRMQAAMAEALLARHGEAPQQEKLMADARLLRLDAARLRDLQAAASGKPADTLPANEAGWTPLRSGSGDRRMAIAERPVTRGDYARFAEATNRDEALCRERGSLLRIFSPRSWKSPGFEQTDAQPVVCVSWQDAQAYARWLGSREGRDYRLATPHEANAAPAKAQRELATWSDVCGAGGCGNRVVAARDSGDNRPLQGDRGYDDVGIRLVRDQ